jgi:hypothetical protein
MKIYLAGPMTGIPQFNFPAFYAGAAALRNAGFDVVSPAEMDKESGVADESMASATGDIKEISQTWGDLLARDVKLLADTGIQGIVFLPDWQRSRGAKLEATVGLLCGFSFYEYKDGTTVQKDKEWVKHQLSASL